MAKKPSQKLAKARRVEKVEKEEVESEATGSETDESEASSEVLTQLQTALVTREVAKLKHGGKKKALEEAQKLKLIPKNPGFVSAEEVYKKLARHSVLAAGPNAEGMDPAMVTAAKAQVILNQQKQDSMEVMKRLNDQAERPTRASTSASNTKETPVAKDLSASLITNGAHYGVIFQSVASLTSAYHNVKALQTEFAPDQMVPTCTTCLWTWRPSVQKGDLETHFASQRHKEKAKDKASQPGRETKLTAFCTKKNTNALEIKVAHVSRYTGIPPQKLETALKMLGGMELPVGGVNVRGAVRKHGEAMTKASLAAIRQQVESKAYVLIHDLGTIGGASAQSIIIQTRDLSFALPLIWAPNGESFDGDELLSCTKEALKAVGIEHPPLLVRSDRGGATGSASRQLAASWGVPFVSCPAHLANNGLSDLLDHLKDTGTTAWRVVHYLNALFETVPSREARWKALQQVVNVDVKLTDLRKQLQGVAHAESALTKAERRSLFDKQLEEMKSAVASDALRAKFDGAENASDLLHIGKVILSELESTNNLDKPPAKVMPLPSDTRYVHTLEAYIHVRSRLRALFIFVAQELKKAGPKACKSLKDLGALLAEHELSGIEKSLDTVIAVTGPVKRLFEKYADAQTQKVKFSALRVFSDIECAIEDLDEMIHSESRILREGLQTRWKNSIETGWWFWNAMRHLDPNVFRSLRACQKALVFDDIKRALPLNATDEMWELYTRASDRAVVGTSLEEFWGDFPGTTSAAELEKQDIQLFRTRVLDLISINPACTQPDSLFSLARDILPFNRQASSLAERTAILFHGANQDIAGHYPDRARLRRGFPKSCPSCPDDDEQSNGEVVDLTLTWSYEASLQALQCAKH